MRKETNMTLSRRALLLGSVAANAALAKKKPVSGAAVTIADVSSQLLNVTLYWPVTVELHNPDGRATGTVLGYAVAIPQCCRTENYGTPEWIQEIKFVSKDSLKSYGEEAFTYFQSHAPLCARTATGCGHISKNVKVTQVAKNSAGDWPDTPNSATEGKTFHCLVARGSPQGQYFQAHQIWISEQDWSQCFKELKDACGLTLPHSNCGDDTKYGPCKSCS